MKKSFKIFISTILVLVLMMTVAFAVPGRDIAPGQQKKDYSETEQFNFEFNDMTGHWAMKAVQNMAKMGKIKGIGNGKFAPASAAKQIEVLILALREMDLEGDLDLETVLLPAYKGIKPQSWMVPYINLAMEHGLLTKAEAEKFNPNQPASRSWTAVIIVRALERVTDAEKLQDAPLPYKDAAAVPVERIGYVNYVTQKELMIGHNNTFQPNKPLSRAEMAQVFYNLNISKHGIWHTVKFVENGGTDVNDITVYHYERIGKLPEISRTGYTFDGWYTVSDTTKKVTSNYIVTEDLILKAEWTINQYTITFDTNGAKTATPTAITLDYGKDVVAPDEPEKDKKQFLGWYPELPKTMPAMDMILVAQWENEPYEVIFDSNGGTTVEAIYADFNKNFTKPADPTRDGYSFSGWFYDDEDFKEAVDFNNDTVTRDVTLYAKWTPEATE